MQLKIKGQRHWLWRAVDKHGVVLDILVQQRRDQQAAETFLRRVIASTGSEPRDHHRQAVELSTGTAPRAAERGPSATQGTE